MPYHSPTCRNKINNSPIQPSIYMTWCTNWLKKWLLWWPPTIQQHIREWQHFHQIVVCVPLHNEWWADPQSSLQFHATVDGAEPGISSNPSSSLNLCSFHLMKSLGNMLVNEFTLREMPFLILFSLIPVCMNNIMVHHDSTNAFHSILYHWS